MQFKLYGVLGMFCALTACATTGHYHTKLNALVGQSAETILTQWGEPRGDVILENGDRLLTYIRIRTIIIPGTPSLMAGPVSGGGGGGGPYNIPMSPGSSGSFASAGNPTDTMDLRCMTKFYIHAGIVQKWTVDGNDCKSR